MPGLITLQISQKLYTVGWRALSSFCTLASNYKPPYWISKFPDGRTRSFEDIPLIEEKNYDIRKYHEISMQFFRKYGYVSKELLMGQFYTVHLFHFDDFKTVYYADGDFPVRRSHRIMRHYREARPDLYENVGLGAGVGEEWWALRKLMRSGISERIIRPLQPKLEEVADDLVKMLLIKSNEGAAVDMLSWLFRWAFESTGVIALNKRLNALSEGSEEADKMVEAAGITNEMIALSEVDWANYEQHYKTLVPQQDFMYDVVLKYVNEIAAQDDPKGVVKQILKRENGTTKNAVTLTMDVFQGALQTVPLTVLMALYNLAKNKHVQDDVREKLMKLLPSKDSKYFGTVTKFTDDVPRYLSSVVWETLRLSPPIIGNGRVLNDDLILGGYQVPKGTNTILHHQVSCLLEENFRNPLEFKPERHPTVHQTHLEYVFGARARTCLGKNFSLGQMCLVLAKILRHFEICYNGGEINIINRLHNEPENPLFLELKPVE